MYTISLQDDIANASVTVNHPAAVVTPVGNGHTLSGRTNIATVHQGILHLGDGVSELILTSDNESRVDPGLIYITKNGNCHMYDQVTLKDRRTNNDMGGGVSVAGGTFHMHGV